MTLTLLDGSLLVLDPTGLGALARLLLEATAVAGLGLLVARRLAAAPARDHAVLRATAAAVLLVAPVAFAFRALGLGVLPGATVHAGLPAAAAATEDTATAVVRSIPLAALVAGGWAVAATWRTAGVLRRLRAAARMIGGLPTSDDGDLVARAGALAGGFGLDAGRLRIAVAPEGSGPLAWGWQRPTVALPAGMASIADPDEMDAVLRHELAHLVRRDHRAWLLGDLVRALLPLHPFARRLRSRLRATAEAACDDAAIAGGVPGDRYAALLLRLVRGAASGGCTPPVRGAAAWPVPAMAAAPSELSRRVERALADARREPRATGGVRLVAATLALATVAVAAALQPAPLRAAEPQFVDPARPLVALPGVLDLGVVAVAGQGRGTLELVNLGREPVTITGHRATCGCTTVEGLAPGVVRPGERVSAVVRMNAPENPGETKVKQVHVLLDGLEPLVIEVRLVTRGGPDEAMACE